MENNNFSTDGIFTMGEAVANGFKFAFIEGNRNVNPKNVKAKVASIQKYGCNLVPLMVVEGAKALADGCRLTDVTTGEEITDGANVLAIIDGQHRTKAALKAEIDLNSIHCYKAYVDAPTVNLLSVSNTDSTPWNGADYAQCAVTMRPDDEIAQFVSELSGKGFKLSTIGLILYRKSGVLTKVNMGKLINGEPIKTSATANLETANMFLAAAAGFPDDFVAKRYLIEAVIDAANLQGFKPVCDKVASWDERKRKFLKEASSTDVMQTLKRWLA